MPNVHLASYSMVNAGWFGSGQSRCADSLDRLHMTSSVWCQCGHMVMIQTMENWSPAGWPDSQTDGRL